MTRLSVALTCLVVLVSCGTSTEQTVEREPTGVFVDSPCPVEVPDGLVEGESIRCGTVAVPEFHSDPDSRRLHLQVAVFPSVGENPAPDPLFVATAGPGVSPIETVTPEIVGPLGPALLGQRDLVLIDSRGLPLANPSLMCPEISDWGVRALEDELSDNEYMAGQLQVVAACRDRLRAEGVTLEAYNNTEAAADVVMVMSALEYEKFNVYGTSAGTILAQHLLRNHSNRLRSVIIDSTVPAGRGNVHIEAPTISAEMLDSVLRLCELDPTCAAAYPDLREEALAVVQRYDLEPATVIVSHPATGEPFEMILTGHRVTQGLLMLNSQTSTVPMIPFVIHQLANGETGILEEILWAIAPPTGNFAWGLGTSIFCMEYSDFTEDEILFPGLFEAYEQHIATQAFGATTIARTCEMWGVDLIDAELRQPVHSDVRVLLMAGTLDSLTPPSWAHEVAGTLPNAQVVEVPGYAHSPTFGGECTAMTALEFLADPTQPVDTSCIDALEVEFFVPE